MNYLKQITSRDGTSLYAKINEGEGALVNVVIVHGLAEHLDRYDDLAIYLHRAGCNVIRYDQRGHGRSGGTPVFYSRREEMVEDLDAVVDFVQSNYTGQVYLIGHSMGGLNVVLYGTNNPGKVDGIITSGALTRGHNDLSANLEADLADNDYFPNDLSTSICSTPDIAEKYALDDFIAREISVGLMRVMEDGVAYLRENAEAFTDKILIMHGDRDSLVSVQDSLDLYAEVASANKSLRIYEGLEHEILNEASYNDVIYYDVASWIGRQS